jgi:hypothetical protein
MCLLRNEDSYQLIKAQIVMVGGGEQLRWGRGNAESCSVALSRRTTVSCNGMKRVAGVGVIYF